MTARIGIGDGTAMCKGAITDGTGEVVGLGTGYHWLDYTLYPAAGGAPVGSMRAYQAVPRPFVPQPHGFHSSQWGTGPGPFVAYDGHGNETARGTTLGDVLWLAEDPAGGSAVLTVSGYPSPANVYRLERVDEAGHLVGAAELDRTDCSAVGVAASGNALVLCGKRARWFGRDGSPRTAWFDAAPLSSPYASLELRPLADGSLAERDTSGWVAVYAELATSPAAPPGWLAQRPWADAYVVRAGGATALAPDRQGSECHPAVVELFAPSGERCGSVTLPVGDCARVVVGKDGTVVAERVEREAPLDFWCAWEWWSALLR